MPMFAAVLVIFLIFFVRGTKSDWQDIPEFKILDERTRNFLRSDDVEFFSLGVERNVSEEKIEAFMGWLMENGMKMKKHFKISNFGGKGLGLMALEPIKKKQTIFTLPYELILIPCDIDSIEHPYFREMFKIFHDFVNKQYETDPTAARAQIPPFDEILTLIYHKFYLKEKSFFYPYFEVTPSVEHYKQLPYALPRKTKRLFKGSLLYEDIIVVEEILKKIYEVISPGFFDLADFDLTKSMVHWAYAFMSERSFSFNKIIARSMGMKIDVPKDRMLGGYHPLMDLINFGGVTVDPDLQIDFKKVNKEKGFFKQISIENIEKGEEIVQSIAFNFAVPAVFNRLGFFNNYQNWKWADTFRQGSSYGFDKHPGIPANVEILKMKNVHPQIISYFQLEWYLINLYQG